MIRLGNPTCGSRSLGPGLLAWEVRFHSLLPLHPSHQGNDPLDVGNDIRRHRDDYSFFRFTSFLRDSTPYLKKEMKF